MKSARFLVVAVLLCIGIAAACVSCSYRQYPGKTINVSGYVLDAVTRKPVADVVVEDSEIQDTSRLPRTDSSGHFVLHLSGSRRRRNRKLSVQTLCYEGNTAMLSNTTQQATILLRRNTYRLKPYGCQIPADSSRILPYADRGIKWFPGSQYAFLIRDSTIHQPRKLQTVTFRLGKEGLPREPFRIRIYRYSGAEQSPGEDLLTDNIAWIAHEGVSTVDVSAYNVILPAEGFFIGIEYNIDIHFTLNTLEGYTPTGPILRPPCARPDIRTWEYVIGQGWQRAIAVENYWPLYESAISVEVEPAPAKR